jgi:hypothetical protein
VLTISIAKLKPSHQRLTGAVTGDAHGLQLKQLIARALVADRDTVILDFADIESASASYLKRLINPFFETPGAPEGLDHEVSPILTKVEHPDLKEDLEDYLAGKGRVLIHADIRHGRPKFKAFLGRLDGAAAETFKELRELKQATAAQLHERHDQDMSNQTAWNNRLVQLVDMRIARRAREGRFWIYQPTVSE